VFVFTITKHCSAWHDLALSWVYR